MSFAQDIKRFVLKAQTRTYDIFVGTGIEVHRSIQTGSEITGAPGQPVDTSYLANSWQLGWGAMPKFPGNGEGADKDPNGVHAVVVQSAPSGDITEAFVATNAKYAADVEDNLRGVTYKNHGPHSVKLTVAGFPRIVDQVTREVVGNG